MPYPPSHRAETRMRIVDSARRLFNRHGFENVSIAQIMAGSNLTHGGFYSYFKGKSDLYSEVLNCFFTDPEWKNNWDGVSVDIASADVGTQVVNAYLSRQHYENVENSCPMIALPTDVARSGIVWFPIPGSGGCFGRRANEAELARSEHIRSGTPIARFWMPLALRWWCNKS
jgi:TetR/AcrR family transcriptional regulator, transcriptional repressor for nem operon